MSVKVPSLTEIYEKYNKIIENEESILKNEFIQTFKNKYGRMPFINIALDECPLGNENLSTP